MGLRDKDLELLKNTILTDFEESTWDMKYDLPQSKLYEICKWTIYSKSFESYKLR